MPEPAFVATLSGWSFQTYFDWFLIFTGVISVVWDFVKGYRMFGSLRERRMQFVTLGVGALISLPWVFVWVPIVNKVVRILWQ